MKHSWTVRHILAQELPFERTFVVTLLEDERGSGRRLYFDTNVGPNPLHPHSYIVATEEGIASAEPLEYIGLNGQTLEIRFHKTGAEQLRLDQTISLAFDPVDLLSTAKKELARFAQHVKPGSFTVDL